MPQEEIVENNLKINQLKITSHRISVRFKVVELNTPRIVRSKKSGKSYRVAQAKVADETAQIDLILWNDEIDEIEVEKGYLLRNGRITVYNESMQLARGYSGQFFELEHPIDTSDHVLDMSKPFMGVLRRKSKHHSGNGRTFEGVPGRVQRGYCTDKEF
ncbi:MAG: hypothetical protein ACFFEF_03325 [Candidatus Thorarchaeota archaeon]